MIAVTASRRVYLYGHRVHHGLVGGACLLGGLALVLHDLADWRLWLPDLWRRV